ncbi:MAG: phosphoribosylformylglycinamidine synthase I [Candidatus Altiarchaeota archaeon]|nr:phosphoribosylformylglycinamidine synthase I [Candidatus Altiarchaeota archaeon]
MIGVLQFPGSNCDLDVLKVLKDVVKTDVRAIWFKETDLSDLDGLVIPGGFSYGDHLRAGAIAARMPALESVKVLARAGKPVLGICNGFQILTESGLLPGTLSPNLSLKFICRWINLRAENNSSVFTNQSKKGEVIKMPIAHGEGRFLCDPKTLKQLKENDQIAFTYVDEKGQATEEANPNGSLGNIAGVCNEQGNVLGLMPHPERASFELLGSTDGKKMFESMVNFISSK